MAVNMSTAGTPKANGKHVSLPRQCTLCLNSGVRHVDNKAPMLIANVNLVV